MAEKPLSTSRRTLLGAAAALPVLTLIPSPARPEPVEGLTLPPGAAHRGAVEVWNRRDAHYRRLAAASEEAATTGWLAAAYARYDRERAEIAARFGSPEAEAKSEAGRRQRRAAFEQVDAAEEAYWDRCTEPMQKAAVALALTPAPNLPALAAKLGVMRAHELHELPSMTRDCFEVLEEDVRRL